jgi:hypothetical protein
MLCCAALRCAGAVLRVCRAQSQLGQVQARNAELERLLAAAKTELSTLQVRL